MDTKAQESTIFETNPAKFIEESIKTYVRESPDNCIKEPKCNPIFDEPLVGFADGDDPLFQEFKKIIGDFHLTPREALEKHLHEEPKINKPYNGDVSVISWALPLFKEIRVSNRAMTFGASLLWNRARWDGRALAEKGLTGHVFSLLRERGYYAVAPGLASFFQQVNLTSDSPTIVSGLASSWSEKHIAYAAGLGTFGLSGTIITPNGVNVRLGSVVTSLKLPPTPRLYTSHRENCAFFKNGTCGLCVTRCPSGALTAQGLNKEKCRYHSEDELVPWFKKPGYTGKYIGCALCLTGVSCESGIPRKVSKRYIP